MQIWGKNASLAYSEIKERVIIGYSTKPVVPTAPQHRNIWLLFGAVHVNNDVYNPFYDFSHIGLSGNAGVF